MDMKILIVSLLLASSAFAAEPDPRLQKIAEQRAELMEQMGRAKVKFEGVQIQLDAIRIIEQGEAELRKLSEEEAKIKTEKAKKE